MPTATVPGCRPRAVRGAVLGQQQRRQLVVVDVTGRGHHHVAETEVPAVIGADIVLGHVRDGGSRAKHRVGQRMIAEHGLGQHVVDQFLR